MTLAALEYQQDKERYNLHCINCWFCSVNYPSLNIRDARWLNMHAATAHLPSYQLLPSPPCP